MNIKTHKVVASILNLAVVLASFEALIAIVNLNEPVIYIRTAFVVGIFHILQIFLLYDLHYKIPGSLERARKHHESVAHWLEKTIKVFIFALWDRCSHLRQWKFFRQWLNYLVLPGIIFWSTISIFFINFNNVKIQQSFVLFSSLALALNYWYLKEIFIRGKEKVDEDVFVILSVVKIYSSAIMYGVSLALIKRYCLDASFLQMGVFALTFLLVYQALFQHRLTNLKNISIAMLISVIMSVFSYSILVYWGYNYFTAGALLAAGYNLLWGVFHYKLDKTLTWHSFWEILIISLVVGVMLFGTTNFKARILDDCQYRFQILDIRY